MKAQLVTHPEHGEGRSIDNTEIRIPNTGIRIAINSGNPNAGIHVFRDHPGDDIGGVTVIDIEVPDELAGKAHSCLVAQEAIEACEEQVQSIIEKG